VKGSLPRLRYGTANPRAEECKAQSPDYTARNTTRPQPARAHSKSSAVENGAFGSGSDCAHNKPSAVGGKKGGGGSGSNCSATQHAHNTPTRTTSHAQLRTGGSGSDCSVAQHAHNQLSAVENGGSGSGSDCSATQHAHSTPTRTTSQAKWKVALALVLTAVQHNAPTARARAQQAKRSREGGRGAQVPAKCSVT